MYDNNIKIKRFVIYSKKQFDNLINLLFKKYIIYNVTGFFSKQYIYVNVKSNKKDHKPFIFIFDVSNAHNSTYVKYLHIIKTLE